MVSLYLLLFIAVVGAEARGSLKNSIHGGQVAQDYAAQAQRLQDLASLASSSSIALNTTGTTATSGTATATTSGTATPTTSAAVMGTAGTNTTTVGFAIYSASNLPTGAFAPPSACATALMATIECNSTILLMGINPSFDAPSLQAMCTASCTSSLQSYRANVVSACVDYTMPTSNNRTYPPTLAADTILEPYNTECLTDPTTGEYCNAILPSYGPIPAQGVLGYPQNELCTPCMLGTLNVSLSNPLTFSYSGYSSLQSALNLCGSSYDGYNVTNPPGSPTTIFTPGPATTPVGSNSTVSSTCNITGRNITTSTNSTCTSIANQYSVTWYDVVSNNPTFNFASCNVPSGTTLCLPQACTTYVAANSGPLASLNQSISETQLTSFNPMLGTGCTQIANQYGQNICISPHGGFPNVAAGYVAVPTPTAIAPPPGPTVSGTTSNCGAWFLVPLNANCNQVVMNNSITLSEFLLLNPEVNSNCTNLWANYNYCVAPYPPLSATPTLPPITNGTLVVTSMALPPMITPTLYDYPTGWLPAPTGVASGTVLNGCYYYYQVQTGDNCTSVAQTFGLSYQDFVTWNNNPSMPCPSLTPGSYVCVDVANITDTAPPTPTNAAPGSAPSGCYEWYTIVQNDGCGSVETQFNLTQAQFFALNPELYSNCTNLVLGDAYCVEAIPTSTTTSTGTPTPTTTTSASPTPTNIEPGSWTNCTQYYNVQSGDNCNVIEDKYNITFSDLLQWNPEINTTCSNLALASYCVQGSNPCTTVYQVQSGNYCSEIETQFGITSTQLTNLNPWLDSNCDLQVGQILCIARTAPTTTTSAMPTTTTPTPTATSTVPANLEPGSWSNCTTYYNVQSGDNCNVIETKYNIAFSDLLRWNPEINTACSNLALASYCVGAPNGCTDIYTVVSGDYCSEIETNYGITAAELQSLNPWLDANCDLQVGQNLCI
ncbi:carbohydrate-binding module family 50 protein [Hydnomerulius pinastri MD-312]|uniref:Carbohydrate-binding module family 50 protein n=1 Tax=Hydnomerulius pinastri MD-312 TaxID=994086 RepID=A0A0C9VMQ7_9AGAM|nr:carbohydrate-binding module family 50 protein [Hydnomerulius pinastri MD-312]